MHNRIFIEEDKEFTLDEFAHLVSRAIKSFAHADIGDTEITYSREDVFFTITDVVGFINERTPGNFKVTQVSSQNYQIHYTPPHVDKQRSKKGLILGKAKSALHLKEISGKLPAWAERDPQVMNAIADIQNKPKAAPTIPAEVFDNRANLAIQIFEREGRLPSWVDDDPRIRERVDALLKDEDEVIIPWLKK